MTAPFKERYPRVNLRYNRTGTAGRGMKVLVALGEGRVIADVITSIADATAEFIAMKALADLRDIPGFNNVPRDYVANDGTWASYRLATRCIAYNTEKVNPADLPETWDDLVKNPRWRGGDLALSNLADSWLLALWGSKGEAWARNSLVICSRCSRSGVGSGAMPLTVPDRCPRAGPRTTPSTGSARRCPGGWRAAPSRLAPRARP